ncbi:MAG: hypothetical protein ACM3ZC_03695 [Bacteroidota bacterium]
MRKKRLFIIILAAIPAAFLIWSEVPVLLRADDIRSTGHNAIWLRHAWIGEPHAASAYDSLAARLKAMEIADAYFHAGPLRADGTVDPARYENAAFLLAALRERMPEAHLYAWLGQVEARAGGPLDLSSAAVRENIVQTAGLFLKLGFDGIHYDIEPIHSGNLDFLRLLAATRKLTKRGHGLLSVAVNRPEPFPGVEFVARHAATYPGYWRRDYYLTVAGHADQIAVMTYDSGLYLPGLYSRLVAFITRWSVEKGVRDLRIGIPTYDDYTWSHFPPAENIRSGLRGFKLGLAGASQPLDCTVGAAIYAEWTTEEEEWRAFRHM